MNIVRLFSKLNIRITIIKKSEAGLIFHVKNGRGKLCAKYGAVGDRGLYALLFDNTPLIKLHGDSYLYPTCERLVSAGYGLDAAKDNTIYALSDTLNAPFEHIEKSFADVKPLLGLLPTGYYMLSDKELFPTNGQGRFFWDISSTPALNRATVPVYDDCYCFWSRATSKYLLPTQSPRLYNPERVAHYMDKDDTRAIAYALPDGYLCALLDGHHKACAAALRKRALKTLVIERPTRLVLPHASNGMKGAIIFAEDSVWGDELKESFESVKKTFSRSARLTERETVAYLSMTNETFDRFAWPSALLDTAKSYHDVYTYACIQWAGDLSDERLNHLHIGEELPLDFALFHILIALQATNHPRFTEIAVAIGKSAAHKHIWHETFALLSNVKSDEVERFFIDFLIGDDKLRPGLTKIATDYFR